MIKISTSILSSNNRKISVQMLNKTTTDYIHIDVMDNKFVPNLQFTIEEINNLIALSKKKIDIHLMTYEPEYYIDRINKNNNIEYITIHYEIKKELIPIIKKIKNLGYKVGLAIKPENDIKEIKDYLHLIDLVLIMSVEPGFGGQTFYEETTKKIKNLLEINKNVVIEVDGGINNTTIKKIKNLANIAVVGSYIINNNNYQEAIDNLIHQD